MTSKLSQKIQPFALALAVLIGLPAITAAAPSCDTPCSDGEACIAGALYPYVPDVDAFRTAICSAWQDAGQTEKLYLISDESVWDGGYASNPVYTNGSGNEAPIDVFVYDAMYLEYWRTQTTPVPASSISNASDFVGYARTSLTLGNGSMQALPVLGCTNIMFYRGGDSGMATVNTLSKFLNEVGTGVYISPVPYDKTGAMLNMAGKTTIGVNYMVKGFLDKGAWPSFSPLDDTIITSMTQIAQRASYYNALTGAIPPLSGVEDAYLRAGYFSDGYGRTSIGFSESMSQMSKATRSNLKLKAFPWSDTPGAATMFYSDVVGVNKNSNLLAQGSKLPFTLANLMAEKDVVQDAIAPDPGAVSYLFPARTSVLQTLSADYPLYQQMSDVLNDNQAIMVVMPTDDRDTFHNFGGAVQTAVTDQFSGHCDLATTDRPMSNALAPAVCTPLCQDSGGWLGSWTNQSPPAWPGYAACGCAQCTYKTPLAPTASTAGAATPDTDTRRYLRN